MKVEKKSRKVEIESFSSKNRVKIRKIVENDHFRGDFFCKNQKSKLSIETENQIVSIILELQKEIIQEWISFICEADQETLETLS